VWEAYMNEDPQDEQKYIYNTTARPVEMTWSARGMLCIATTYATGHMCCFPAALALFHYGKPVKVYFGFPHAQIKANLR
jgi:hypothetical protein